MFFILENFHNIYPQNLCPAYCRLNGTREQETENRNYVKLQYMDYYHVYTKGLTTDLLFNNEDDFIYGMNLIPKSLMKSGARLQAFCLMDNHIHFVLKGGREECNNFIISYKSYVCMYMTKNSGRCLSETIMAGASKIGSPEQLRTVIAYVLRNPVAAGYGYIPQDYRWSSAALYFRDTADGMSVTPEKNASKRMDDYTCRERFRILRTRVSFPDDWRIDSSGIILPKHYTEVTEVETLFSSVRRFMYYLSASKETEVRMSMNEVYKIRLDDTELRKQAMRLCLQEYGTVSLNLLDIKQRIRLGRQLRKEFGSSVKQISRIVHVDAEYLRQVLM